MKNIFIAASLLVAVSNALAEIPHTFTANTPAKASEVNANFEYLDNKLSVSEQSQEYKCYDNHVDYPYTYSRKEAPLGTALMVGESEYRLVKIAVTDPRTNQIFHVTYPVYSAKRPDETRYVSFPELILYPMNGDYDCNNNLLSNQPSAFNKNIGFTINTSNRYSNFGEINSSGYKNNSSNSSISIYAQIIVGSQYLTFSFAGNGYAESTVVNSDDYDFTNDKITLSTDFSTPILEISTLLDHIIIEKITQ